MTEIEAAAYFEAHYKMNTHGYMEGPLKGQIWYDYCILLPTGADIRHTSITALWDLFWAKVREA